MVPLRAQPVQHVILKRRNSAAASYNPGGVSMSRIRAARRGREPLPSGRKAGKPLANGVGAVIGAESNGLLSNFNSMGKINFYGNFDTIWNVRIDGGSPTRPKAARISPGWSVPSSTRRSPRCR